jgi:hypothetical protein
MQRRILSTLVMASLILTLFPALGFALPLSEGVDGVTVDGVLTSDYYELYPYAPESLSIGFSKYGELINLNDDGTGTGMQYPGYESVGTYDQTELTSRDPFGNEGININRWFNGWLLQCDYRHRWLTPTSARDRDLWAFAMFADGSDHGGEWNTYHDYDDPAGAPHGGRKTTTYAWTEDMTVLYNGPRRTVAQMVTHVYDDMDEVFNGNEWPLVDVVITIVFNGAKKSFIVIKELKLTIDVKDLDGPVDCQFSNRGEWDLGPAEGYDSYAHFYDQDMETSFGDEWHLSDTILRKHVQTFIIGESGFDGVTEDGFTFVELAYPPEPLSEKCYVNGVFQTRVQAMVGDADPDDGGYDADGREDDIIFDRQLDNYDVVECEYKYDKWWEEEWDPALQDLAVDNHIPFFPHQYDIAQIISSAGSYSGFAAFWPILSDFSVDAWDKVLLPLVQTRQRDMVPFSSEPDIPFVVGEWDVLLDYAGGTPWPMQFRGVTVYGLTDNYDGDDEHMGGTLNINREVQFQLNEVFEGWDLWHAMHKMDKRWVQHFAGDGATTTFTVDSYREIEYGRIEETIPVLGLVPGLGWDFYMPSSTAYGVYDGAGPTYFIPNAYTGSVAERVLVDGVLQTPLREVGPHAATAYSYEISWDGVISFVTAPPAGADIKVLWSSEATTTVSEVWKESDIEGQKHFLLNHNIPWYLKDQVELFFVDERATRLQLFRDWEAACEDIVDFGQGCGVVLNHTDSLAPGVTGSQDYKLDEDWIEPGSEIVMNGSQVLTSPAQYQIEYRDGWIHFNQSWNDISVFYDYWPETDILWDDQRVPLQKELDVKYYVGWGDPDIGWVEQKMTSYYMWRGDKNGYDWWFPLEYPAKFVEKVWIHSEKSLTDGDFVFSDHDIVLQEPLSFYGPEASLYVGFWDTSGVWREKLFSVDDAMDAWDGMHPEGLRPQFASSWFDLGYDIDKTTIYEVGVETLWDFGPGPDIWLDRGNFVIRETAWSSELVLDQSIDEELDWFPEDERELKIVYEVPGGRYELGVVGRDAASIDSIGLSSVVAAVKNKGMEYGIGALDMVHQPYTEVPNVLDRFGAGNAKTDYRDSLDRNALINDWSTMWPVKSSNMIVAGGPGANEAARYWNDGPSGFFAISAFADPSIASSFFAMTGWSRFTYAASGDTGYGVVSTYQDIDGTVGLLVYGYDARDTDYVSKWFEYNKFKLQHINLHVDTLILRLDYSSGSSPGSIREDMARFDHNPKITVLEWLGTISEKAPHEDP